jgi:hypothetical protein
MLNERIGDGKKKNAISLLMEYAVKAKLQLSFDVAELKERKSSL